MNELAVWTSIKLYIVFDEYDGSLWLQNMMTTASHEGFVCQELNIR